MSTVGLLWHRRTRLAQGVFRGYSMRSDMLSATLEIDSLLDPLSLVH